MATMVTLGLIGTNLDAGDGVERWNRWRPTVSLCQHEELLIDRLDLLHQRRDADLVKLVREDIRSVSPETEVRPHQIEIRTHGTSTKSSAHFTTSRARILSIPRERTT
jgi:transcriptional regulatory protein RtcR